jgi:hypothetical protein
MAGASVFVAVRLTEFDGAFSDGLVGVSGAFAFGTALLALGCLVAATRGRLRVATAASLTLAATGLLLVFGVMVGLNS